MITIALTVFEKHIPSVYELMSSSFFFSNTPNSYVVRNLSNRKANLS